MKILGTFVLLLGIGLVNNVEAHQKSDWIPLGTVANSQEGGEDRHTRDDDASFRDRGSLLGSFRRTAARLQEYDGLTPTGDFRRDGLDWYRKPISETKSAEEIKGLIGEGRPGLGVPARWSKKVSVPDTASEYMIFFTMQGCTGCVQMYPIIEELQAEGYEIYVVKRRVNLALVRQHDISSFPTCIIFEDGKQVKRLGVTDKATILKYLKKPTPDTPDTPDTPNNTDLAYDFVDGPDYKLW